MSGYCRLQEEEVPIQGAEGTEILILMRPEEDPAPDAAQIRGPATPTAPDLQPTGCGRDEQPRSRDDGPLRMLTAENHQVLKHLRAEGRLPGLAPGNPT